MIDRPRKRVRIDIENIAKRRCRSERCFCQIHTAAMLVHRRADEMHTALIACATAPGKNQSARGYEAMRPVIRSRDRITILVTRASRLGLTAAAVLRSISAPSRTGERSPGCVASSARRASRRARRNPHERPGAFVAITGPACPAKRALPSLLCEARPAKTENVARSAPCCRVVSATHRRSPRHRGVFLDRIVNIRNRRARKPQPQQALP